MLLIWLKKYLFCFQMINTNVKILLKDVLNKYTGHNPVVTEMFLTHELIRSIGQLFIFISYQPINIILHEEMFYKTYVLYAYNFKGLLNYLQPLLHALTL